MRKCYQGVIGFVYPVKIRKRREISKDLNYLTSESGIKNWKSI